MEVNVREFKAKCSHYLKLASGGEVVVVTSHGSPIAKVCAMTSERFSDKPSVKEVPRLTPLDKAKHALEVKEAQLGLKNFEAWLKKK